MPVDYSKWDNLELSDDSDIEVHPNVDKRSFIRAKQAQIHQQRAQRKHQITTLKYERIINDGLLLRIGGLLTALKSHTGMAQSLEELVFQSLMESAGDPAEDAPPPPPEGVHQNVKDQPTYSKMMAALVDQVKKAVDESKTEDRLGGFIKEVEEHQHHVEDLQKQLHAKLDELEKEEKRHITSDDLHTGFDYSKVRGWCTDQTPAASTSKSGPKATVELLNPGATSMDGGQSSGADADIEDGPDPDDADDIRASKTAKEFSRINVGDYSACLDFISKHPEILTEKESDGLLVEAFDCQMDGKDVYAKQCVHQALLIQYCRQLGRDGVRLFFKRITTRDHQANKLFRDDVNNTYNKIRERAHELAKQKDEEGEGVEQIQLHAVDPDTEINITVPPPIPEDLSAPSDGPPPTEDQIAARRVFESFPPGLRRALESGSLDEVNKVLGKISVEEAEDVVQKLGEGGMLNLENKVIDGTTDEGKALIEEIERTRQIPSTEEEAGLSADPPLD
ncbi:hypothetical protein EJ06DRAFT_480955 [Trichodelitschia bisporula]|uniref:Hsp90 chaperone protein kinase-targeting subunit n=1 Tax=Trichodelitschia bisporula TaxID=703511 RepID=A0A6G1HPJ2_9PEZI|nr:hypothetical protein EJ06DRAFT_480955 [Trichodelitschia bisporula]